MPFYALRSYQDGGEHYPGQLGAEPTPQAFLEALWAITGELARVLKPSGSLWLELGDSYSRGKTSTNKDYQGVKGRGIHRPGAPSEWTTTNAAWLAAVLDCEGSVSGRIFKTPSGSESFVTWMRVSMMDREVVERIHEITGVGTVSQDKRGAWTWHVASQACRYVLERIWPWLLIKQKRALAAIELCRHVEERAARGFRTLTHDDLAYRAKIVQAIRDWNGHPARPNDYEPPRIAPVMMPDSLAPSPEKSLMLLPERYRVGCVDRLGLIARAVIIWHRPNGLPESVTDRVRRSHSDWVHLTKQPRYYSAVDEVREAYSAEASDRRAKYGHNPGRDGLAGLRETGAAKHGSNGVTAMGVGGSSQNPLGKLPGSVWNIPTEPLRVPEWVGVDHFAAMATELPRRIILGWSPSGVCTACGEGRRPVVEKDLVGIWHDAAPVESKFVGQEGAHLNNRKRGDHKMMRTFGSTEATITGEACACPTPDAPTRPAVVLDPFAGTGTTCLVARALGRHGVGLDLSADYLRLAGWRIWQSGHGAKAEQRTWKERQGGLFDNDPEEAA